MVFLVVLAVGATERCLMGATLVLLLLSTTPNPDQRIVRIPAPDLGTCSADGDKAALAWLDGHPGWTLVGWRCEGR